MQEETVVNVDMELGKDKILVIKVDMNQEHGETGNGKAIRIASTRGTRTYKDAKIGTFRVGVNVTKPKP